jgi:glycerophosphoryl diester phosphodiesterase
VGRKTRMAVTTIAIISLLIAAILILLGLLGTPSKGKRLVQNLGIPRPAIIAHRGASFLAPEETRPAFLLARELGADYLEFDIQRTKDGVLIALHDDNLSRTTNVDELFPGRGKDTIDTFTYTELQRLDAGSSFNRRFSDRARASFKGLGILRIEEILEIAEKGSRRPGIYIETKAASRFPGIEKELVDILTQRGWIEDAGSPGRARVVFQSFESESLARLKSLAPGVPRVLLIDEAMTSRETWEGLLAKAAELGHGIGTWGFRWALGPDWSVRDSPTRYVATWPWYTGQAHRTGLFVHCWTIDDRWEMWMVTLGGADGIFTNRAELALTVYGRPTPDLDSLWKRIGYE